MAQTKLAGAWTHEDILDFPDDGRRYEIIVPLDVFIPGGGPVQPDVLVVLPDGNARVELRGIEGPPTL